MARFKGEKVTFINGLSHSLEPDKYPSYGTRGKIVDAIREPFAEAFYQYLVEWEDGTKSYVMDNLLLPQDTVLKECPIKVGEMVRFINDAEHTATPQFYPEVGVKGIVTDIIGPEEVRVQWPEGSTKPDGNWCVDLSCLERIGG
jgi:hypothetical protein